MNVSLLIPLLVCLVLNFGSLAVILSYNPSYLKNYRANPNPDARDYVLLGRNLFLQGAYSRNIEPPFSPDLFRTPAYPIFAGGLDILGGPWLIYIVQLALHMGICLAVFRFGELAWSERAGFLAGLLVAIHPTLLSLTVQAMSELLFLFFLLFSVLSLAKGLQVPDSRIRTFLLSGLLLGLAILTRPAGLFLPLLIAGFVTVTCLRAGGFWGAIQRAGSFVAGVVLVVTPWIARNAVVFHYPVLTTNDTVVLVYYTGAGAYQVHHGVEWDRAVERIADEYALRRPEEMWNSPRTGGDPVEMDRDARRAIWPVLSRYPASLAYSCGLGLAKSMLSHDAEAWATILRVKWIRPGTQGLVRLDGAALTLLMKNEPVLVAGLTLQLAINVLLILTTIAGTWRALRSHTAACYLILLLLLFFMAMCAASGIDAFTRFSAPFLPFAALVTGGWMGAWYSPEKGTSWRDCKHEIRQLGLGSGKGS